MRLPVNSVLRRTLGVEVHRVNSGRDHPPPYEFTAKRVRRLVYFQELLGEVADVEGDIVECGVSVGTSLFTLSMLSSLSDRPRRVYGFDSFRGLPEPSQEDKPWRYAKIRRGHFAATKEAVVQRLIRGGIPADFVNGNISLVEGFFPDTFEKYEGPGIALLHLDVDLYWSYRQALEHFYPLVNPGGVIAFDEYDSHKWVGATKAIDEFFDGREPLSRSSIFDVVGGPGTYVVKD